MSASAKTRKSAARSRIGKVARLPGALREQLNQRLADGESGPSVLAWLNDLPEVRKALAREFGGRPVNAQNLSDWRRGGHQDWLRHQEELAEIAELEHVILNFSEFDWPHTLRFLGDWGAFHYARLLRGFRPSGKESEDLQRLKELTEEVLAFQRGQAEVGNAILPVRQHEDEIHLREREAEVKWADAAIREKELQWRRAARDGEAAPSGTSLASLSGHGHQAKSGQIKVNQAKSR